MSQDRDHAKAGLFVLVGLLVTAAVIVVLADIDAWTDDTQTVRVQYHLSDGLQGLKVGAPVKVGGEAVGHVTRIDDMTQKQSSSGLDRVVSKLVTFVIPQRYQLFTDARIDMQVPAIGSGTALNIADVGRAEPYQPGDVIQGRIAPSKLARDFVAQLGIRQREQLRIRQIIERIESISMQVDEDWPALAKPARELLVQANEVARRVDAIAVDLEKVATDVERIVSDIEARAPALLDSANGAVREAKQTIASIRQVIDENQADVRKAMANIERITESLRTGRMRQITELLDGANETVAQLQAGSRDLSTLIRSQSPVLQRAFANLQLTAEQLKLASIEVRRAPWRLLYEPDRAELESDNLYDATRSFAMAASSLESAAASLRAMQSADADSAQVSEQLDYLQALFDKFRDAEQGFWRALNDHLDADARPARTPSSQ